MNLGLRLPTTSDAGPVEWAARAENRGFESVWQGELWGWNVFVQLAEVAQRTSDVRMGTAIVNVFSRSPAVLAMSGSSLDRLSGGRAVLGLGASTPKVVEDLHGREYDRPVRRTHETVELVAEFLSEDGTVDYDGEVFDISDFSAIGGDVAIYNAALGPANRRATGRLCDGWLPNNVPFSNFEAAFETIAEAARGAGRVPDNIEVAPWIHVVVDDEDPAGARDAVRDTIAYYVGSGEGYRNAIGTVFPAQADRIATAWRTGEREEARASVTDEMVDDLACTGSTEAVHDQLRTLVDETPIDLPIVDIPPGTDDDRVEQTFEAVAPDGL